MPESRLASLRNAFISGLIMLAPIAVTWLVFSWLIENIGGGIRPLIFPASLADHILLQFAWNVVLTFLVLALITGLGWLSRYVLGQFFTSLAERFILTIPGVNTVYTTVKQLVDTFGPQRSNAFSKVVLVEYPRKDCWSVGFLTNRQQGEPQQKLRQEIWTVFVPTTPNPTSGFLLLLPKEEVIELEMSTGDGMKLIISGGTVLPPFTPPSQSPTQL